MICSVINAIKIKTDYNTLNIPHPIVIKEGKSITLFWYYVKSFFKPNVNLQFMYVLNKTVIKLLFYCSAMF